MAEAMQEMYLSEDNIDLMRKAAGGAAQTVKMKDGKLKMDMFTASAIMQIFDKVNPANQKKMADMINKGTKDGILKLQDFAMKQLKSHKDNPHPQDEEVDLDEDASNFKSAVARIKKAKSAKDLKKLEKSFERVYKQTGALTDKEFGQLDDMISDKLVAANEAWELGSDAYRKYLEDLTPMESAQSDAMRSMKKDRSMVRGKDSADYDDDATDTDRKAANKNILNQLKKTLDSKGKTDIEFLDRKKQRVPYDIAVKAIKKYMSLNRPQEKLKFQQKIAKSYRDMLTALKEDHKSPLTILDRIDTKIRERKNG